MAVYAPENKSEKWFNKESEKLQNVLDSSSPLLGSKHSRIHPAVVKMTTVSSQHNSTPAAMEQDFREETSC